VNQPDCCTPVSMANLVDYWSGDASTTEVEQFEEHTFACETCSRRLEAVADLARGIARVAAIPGGIGMVVTQALIDRLAAQGSRMRHYRVEPGETVQCTVGPDDDLSVTYLSADLQGVQRVDVVLYAHGKEWGRMNDAPIDRVTGQVIYTVAGDLARTFPAITVRVELHAPEKDGEARVLCEYTFEHTPYAFV
jgi:hypothetical protein